MRYAIELIRTACQMARMGNALMRAATHTGHWGRGGHMPVWSSFGHLLHASISETHFHAVKQIGTTCATFLPMLKTGLRTRALQHLMEALG
jgi:hypothetical protein